MYICIYVYMYICVYMYITRTPRHTYYPQKNLICTCPSLSGKEIFKPSNVRLAGKQRVKLELRGNITKLGGQRQVSTTVQASHVHVLGAV